MMKKIKKNYKKILKIILPIILIMVIATLFGISPNYVGTAGGYKIYDANNGCFTAYDMIYKDNNHSYWMSCSGYEIYLKKGFEPKIKMTVSEALEKEIVTIDELLKTDLKISVDGF